MPPFERLLSRSNVNCSFCSNSYRNTESAVSFFRFPTDDIRCLKWVRNADVKLLYNKTPSQLHKSFRLCSTHFEDSQFMNPQKTSLIKSAVPTLFDRPHPPKMVTPKRPAPRERSSPPAKRSINNSCTDTHVAVVDETDQECRSPVPLLPTRDPDTPRKKKLKKAMMLYKARWLRMKKKKKMMSTLQKNSSLYRELEEILPLKTAKFIKAQIQLCRKGSKHAYRWSLEDKLFCLSVFYYSRKAYYILRQLFALPSKRTLQRTLEKTSIYPGFNKQVFHALTVKVSTFANKDKHCAIIFDEMSLKSYVEYNPKGDFIEGLENFGSDNQGKIAANHALAFMVRGLASNWKQPLGYFLTSGPVSAKDLQTLVKSCLDELESTGLMVNVLICDQGSNNRSFLENLENVSLSKPYIIHNDRKIFVMYDPPHLLKNIRNNLKKSGFKYNGIFSGKLKCKEIKWDYIVDFYEFDVKNGIRMAPKLLEKHIKLKPFTEMRVNLAAQVLSHTVSSGISAMIQLKKLPACARYTAQFLHNFDKLFNTFNSRSLKSSKPYAHAFSENSTHIKFLNDMLKFLNKLEPASGNKSKILPCLEGWKLSITSLLSIWKHLHDCCDFTFLFTSRLNQDCVENLFSIVRGKGGHRDNPSPQQFRAAFRHIIFDKLMVQSDRSNCQADFDKVLIELSSFTPRSSYPVSKQTTADCKNSIYKPFDILSVEIPPSDISKENTAAYIAGYLLKKVEFQCDTCRSQLILPSLPLNDVYIFLKHKAYREEGTLIYPSLDVVNFVDNLEHIFINYFDTIVHTYGVLEKLCLQTVDICKLLLFCQEPDCSQKVMGMARLYMKMRIYHACKVCNNDDSSSGKRNRKYLKLAHL